MTAALRGAVQSLLKDREQQMKKISALEGTGPILCFMCSIQSFKIKTGVLCKLSYAVPLIYVQLLVVRLSHLFSTT